jgi:hypothetical protein
MVSARRYQGRQWGSPSVDGNKIDAIFARGADESSYEFLVFNYNADPEYRQTESLKISMKLSVPPGTKFEVRSSLYVGNRNSFQQFVADHPKAGRWETEGGWVKDGYRKAGQLDFIMNDEGVRVSEKKSRDYVKFNELKWSKWHPGTTKLSGSQGNSIVAITAPLPSFSFHAYSVRIKGATTSNR